jgi:polyisoprenyl-teichoic acid--peptidoglycan teichoic acid transferase
VSSVPQDDRPPRLAWGMAKRFALAGVLLFLLSAATTATAVLLEVKDDINIFKRESTPIPGINDALDDVDPGGPQTILLLGSDRRFVDIKEKNPTRSDTIILVRLDPSKGATALMSLPRDLKVRIPGHGTDKINAAYAIGGPELTVKTVRRLLGIPVHHVINMNFGGFRGAVDKLGCVYTDVDRRYFNDNRPPFGGGPNYATIDIKAGYQKLCGQDALDYVRYRHFDSDLVRAARQQQFLGDAKDQIGVGKLFSNRKTLLRIFGRYTQTDIQSNTAILRLLKLAVESAQNPVQEIHFPGDITGDFVTVTPGNLDRVTKQFLDARGSATPRGAARKRPGTARRRKGSSASLPPGMVAARMAGEDQAVRLAAKVDLPVYYPKAILSTGQYLPEHSRAYRISDRGKHRFRAYRIVVRTRDIGQYYGIQGTTWKAPPILDNPTERRRLGGRQYELFYDGSRLRLVAWRTSKAVYWVSNTLLQTLTKSQMLALARSVSKVG